MESLTIQTYLSHEWSDIAQINFPNSHEGNYFVTEVHYLPDYTAQNFEKSDKYAVSLNYPVNFFFDDLGRSGWLRFLDDIMPSGASRRYWVKQLDIDDLPIDQQNFILLKYGTISPVGNLRVKESLPNRSEKSDSLSFSLNDVINRGSDFLDYAQERGAAAGGATGAGGEAPKLLLRCSPEEDIWIDSYQDDHRNKDIHYLVKYPRGSRNHTDCNILRAEYHYYHELTHIGIDTISTKLMRLEEGEHYPSLWLPRFDIYFDEQETIQRFSMESVYSILQKGPASILDHEETIRALIDKITNSHIVTQQGFQFDIHSFVIEWVKRDLVNILFGNSDNHGRNTSFIKGDGIIKLAPVYDFAPMKADPEGIPRATKWTSPLEVGGEYDFNGIAESLSDLVPKDMLMHELKILAKSCLTLKTRLKTRGVPEQILDMPSIGMDFIEIKLKKWGLL
ncbi:HipA domain-containing protein [Vibrio sp.]|nr:HipA domain-containing protein [Vibrio sp.]